MTKPWNQAAMQWHTYRSEKPRLMHGEVAGAVPAGNGACEITCHDCGYHVCSCDAAQRPDGWRVEETATKFEPYEPLDIDEASRVAVHANATLRVTEDPVPENTVYGLLIRYVGWFNWEGSWDGVKWFPNPLLDMPDSRTNAMRFEVVR